MILTGCENFWHRQCGLVLTRDDMEVYRNWLKRIYKQRPTIEF